MKTITCRTIGLIAVTTLATSLLGQTSVISTTGWLSSTTAPSGSGTLSGQIVAAPTIGVPYNTLSGNGTLASNDYYTSGIPTQYNNTTFGGDLWISFSGGRLTGPNSANFKLSQGTDADTGMVLRVGSISGSDNWTISGGAESGPGTTNTTLSMDTGDKISFVLIRITYGSGAADKASVWIFDSKSGAPTSSASLGTAAASLNGDFAFDRLGLYAAGDSSFAFDTITLSSNFETAVPEPASYALVLGFGTLALVTYRRRRAKSIGENRP